MSGLDDAVGKGAESNSGRGGILIVVVFGQFASAFLFLVFAVAAFGKYSDWTSWSTLIGSLRLQLGKLDLGAGVRVSLPAVELFICVLCFAEPRAGLAVASVTLTGLSVGILALLPRHKGLECGCFGTFARSRLSVSLATRDLLLASVALVPWALTADSGIQTLRPSFLLDLVLAATLLVAMGEGTRMLALLRNAQVKEGER
jgi:hypothetical protein